MGETYDVVIANGTAIGPEVGRVEADIGITGETIAAIASPGTLDGDRVIDASGKQVVPGVIDPHTHHGFYRSLEEDAESESRSGLVGGVTTTGNFFRRGEPYREVLDEYVEQAAENYHHDYYFSLGLLSSTHIDEVPWLIEEHGITTYKWLAHYKYTTKERFDSDSDLLDDFGDRYIETLAAQDVPTTLGYHSENVEITNAIGERVRSSGRDGYEAFLDTFPGYAEAQSMVAGAALAKQHGYDDSFYAVHISSGKTADELAVLQDAGYGVTGETCPHYLTLTAEQCDDRMKVNPPIRTDSDRETLWNRVADGTIDCLGTDHIANVSEEKIGDDIWDSLLAFPSSATMLPLVVSEGVHEGRISLERAVELTSTNNAKAWNLYPRKGSLRIGSDADIVVLDLEETKTVTPELLKSAADYSVYDGWEVTGWPTHTMVRGQLSYEEGEVISSPGQGTKVT